MPLKFHLYVAFPLNPRPIKCQVIMSLLYPLLQNPHLTFFFPQTFIYLKNSSLLFCRMDHNLNLFYYFFMINCSTAKFDYLAKVVFSPDVSIEKTLSLCNRCHVGDISPERIVSLLISIPWVILGALILYPVLQQFSSTGLESIGNPA